MKWEDFEFDYGGKSVTPCDEPDPKAAFEAWLRRRLNEKIMELEYIYERGNYNGRESIDTHMLPQTTEDL